jgi:hypothetical protein
MGNGVDREARNAFGLSVAAVASNARNRRLPSWKMKEIQPALAILKGKP